MPSSAETDSDSSSSSSEGEKLPPTPPPPSTADKNPADQKKPVEPAAQKATDSESDSDDSDSPVKPIASKPMDDSSKLRKPRSKTNYKLSNHVASPSKTSAKRAPTVEEEKDMKKSKKEKLEGGGAEEEEGKKSTLFQRLWSDDDEIVILKGILEYKEKKGTDPMADANDFHDFIKSSLHINVDRSQMVSKVRRLKKRYANSLAKKKTFSAHEGNAFELSKKIWGNNEQSANADRQTKGNMKSTAAAGKSVGSTGRMSAVVINGVMASPNEMKDGGIELENSGQFIGKASISMGLDENIVKMGLGLCKEDKKAEIEEKWKQLHLEENNLWLRKLDLAREESKMVIEALKSGGN